MTERSVTHASFAIERIYDAPPARVFAAFSDPVRKRRWFTGPEEWGPDEHQLDFRVGGREVSRGGPPGGPVITYEARYYDIVPDQRIVLAYEMLAGDARMSVSLATVQLAPAGAGTRLVYTEQDVFLDGSDNAAEREHGSRELLESLAAELQREPATA